MIPLWLQNAIMTWGYLIVFLAIAIESTGIPFPGESTLIAAAVFAGTTGQLHIAGVIVAAALGAIIGDNLGYMVGYHGGYPLLRRFAKALRVDDAKLDLARDYFARHGDKTVFFGRFFALLRAWAALLAGVNRMPWRSFLFWNALGGAVWATVFGTLGYVLGNNLPLLGHVLKVIGVGGSIVLGVVALAALGVWIWQRRMGRQRALLRS